MGSVYDAATRSYSATWDFKSQTLVAWHPNPKTSNHFRAPIVSKGPATLPAPRSRMTTARTRVRRRSEKKTGETSSKPDRLDLTGAHPPPRRDQCPTNEAEPPGSRTSGVVFMLKRIVSALVSRISLLAFLGWASDISAAPQTVSFADSAWNRSKIPDPRVCKHDGGNNLSSALKISGLPVGTDGIEFSPNDNTYYPMGNGGYGMMRFRMLPGSTEVRLPSVSGIDLLPGCDRAHRGLHRQAAIAHPAPGGPAIPIRRISKPCTVIACWPGAELCSVMNDFQRK